MWPLHQSVTHKGPSKFPKADFKAILISDCSKVVTAEE